MPENHNKKTNLILRIEGGDQVRGWFNSSLVISMFLKNEAPYDVVISHGFVVDEEGRKMSKSLGNVIDPATVLKKFGTDVVRMWVASSDYTKEIKISFEILKKVQEQYQKIRNTFRFLIGNLVNFDPYFFSSSFKEVKNFSFLDIYILNKLEEFLKVSRESYAKYNFSSVYQSIVNFCTNDLSSFYFEICKDSLYCDEISSMRRKRIEATLFLILWSLLKLVSPIAPFLTEEVFFKFRESNKEFLKWTHEKESVSFLEYPPLTDLLNNSENFSLAFFEKNFFHIRQVVNKKIEEEKKSKRIQSISKAKLEIFFNQEEHMNYFKNLDLHEMLMCAEVLFVNSKENNLFIDSTFFSFKLEETLYLKCIRCWNYKNLVKDNLCLRCFNVLKSNVEYQKFFSEESIKKVN